MLLRKRPDPSDLASIRAAGSGLETCRPSAISSAKARRWCCCRGNQRSFSRMTNDSTHSVEAVTKVRGSAKQAALTNSECKFSKSETGRELPLAWMRTVWSP